MITISVESDEEQWAIGTALVNGAIGFGDWPFQVKRRYSAGAAAGAAGGRGDSACAAGHNSTAAGGGGDSRGVTISGGSGTITGGVAGGGGSVMPDFFVCPLRTCCATAHGVSHLQGCEETGG